MARRKVFTVYCARCGVGLTTWASKGGSVWKHQTGGNGPLSCRKPPLPISAKMNAELDDDALWRAKHPSAPEIIAGKYRADVVAELERRAR